MDEPPARERVLIATAMGLTPGANFGRYRVDEEIGAGGMGQVFRAFDLVLERAVALKIIKGDRDTDGEVVARFLREARLGAQLTHPNTATVYDAGKIDGVHFIAMEFVRGRVLREFVGDSKIDLARRFRWLADVARGIVAAHSLGILHRDLKSNNVIVQDGTDVAKVLDFGFAKRRAITGEMRRTFQTQANYVVGTPMFMAPEQLMGEPTDARADQFSWGLLAYLLITGKNPRDDDKVMANTPTRVDTIVAGCPSRVGDAVNRTLAFSKEARFPDMNALLVEFERATQQAPIAMAAAPAVIVNAADPVRKSIDAPPGDPHPWRFHLRETSCPIAPLTGACISHDGRRALGFSARGIALFESDWRVLGALPDKISATDILCATGLADGGYLAAGHGALLFEIEPSGAVTRISIDYRDRKNLIFRGIFAENTNHIDLVGSWRDSGVVVTRTKSGSRVLPCLAPLVGVARASRGGSLFVCGPKGLVGHVDESDTLRLHPRVGGDLVAVAATKNGAYACGSGAWLLSFDETRTPEIETIETTSNLTAIALRDGEHWVASEKGRFLRREGTEWKRKSPHFSTAAWALALFASRERLTSVTTTGAIITATPRKTPRTSP